MVANIVRRLVAMYDELQDSQHDARQGRAAR